MARLRGERRAQACALVRRQHVQAQEQVKAIYDVFGPKRLMWGTDWPNVLEYCGYAKALTLVRDDMKFLNADDKHWMLNRTIERVWPFS